MSDKLTRKIASIFIAVVTVIGISGTSALVPAASAQSVGDLQSQIAALLAQIQQLQAQLNAQGSGSGSMTSYTFSSDLTVGSTGADVTALQGILISKGYLKIAAATGYFGSLTKAALGQWQAAEGITPSVGYFGPKSRAAMNAMSGGTGGTGGTGTTPPPPSGAGVSVFLSSGQPANQLAPMNAARVPFTKVTLSAGASAVTVNGITVQRKGPAANSNFSGVVLLDQNGMVMDIEKTLSSDDKATIGGTFTIPAGSSQTFTIAGNMSGTVQGGAVAWFDVVGVNTAATVNGTLPISGGAQHTINGTLTIGTLTAAAGPADPRASAGTVDVGTTEKILAEVRFTTGSAEKVWFRQIRWNQAGSAASSDITNVKTVINGTKYDAVASADGKYYTTTLPGTGIVIDKGNNLDVRMVADIVSGSNRTVNADIYRRTTDVFAVGDSFGYGIVPGNGSQTTGSDDSLFHTGNPWFDGSKFTINAGSVTVSSDNAVGAQNIAVNLAGQPLGGFQVEVKGEPVTVASQIFNLFANDNDGGSEIGLNEITQISLFKDDGTVVAGPVDPAATTVYGAITFTDTITYPVGITHLILKGKLGTDFESNDTVRASTTPSSGWTSITGLTTGKSITAAPTSAVSGNTMTVKGTGLTLSVSSDPIAQTIIAGGRYTFANYILDAAGSGEDIKMSTVPLAYDVIGGGTATDLTNCRLYDGATEVTTGSNVINPSAAGSSTTFTFDGAGFTVPKSSTKTLVLKCDLRAGSTGVYSWGYDSGATFTATGATSGSSFSPTENDSVGQRMTASSGGSLTTGLDAGSPSYVIAAPGQVVELARLRFSATNEDVNLRQLALQLSSVASNSPINLVGQMVTLHTYPEGVQIGTASFSSGDTATSTLLTGFTILKNGAKTLSIKGTMNGISASGPLTASGDLVVVNYDGDNLGINGNYGTGAQSGTTISGGTCSTTCSGNDSNSNGVRVMRAHPRLDTVSLRSNESTLTSGDNKTLYRWSVKNNSTDRDLALYKFSFSVSSSTGMATTSKFSVYAYTSSSDDSSPIPGYNSSTNPSGLINAGNCYSGGVTTSNNNHTGPAGLGALIEVYADKTGCNLGTTTVVIPPNTTYYFRLAASIGALSPSGTAESIQAQIEGDSAFPVNASTLMNTASGTDGDTSDDFIWSPRSTSTTESINDLDWTNGYGVIGLPGNNTAPVSISK